MSPQKKWLVFYTKSRQEKRTAQVLTRKHFEVFLPLQKVLRQWSDRKKKVEVPLFNSYLFVYATEADIAEILQVPGLAWNVRHNGHPAVLQENEIQLIKRFLESGLSIETSQLPDNLEIGVEAEVADGPLAGVRGILLEQSTPNKFLVLVESINQTLKVQIPRDLLRKL